MKPYLQEKTPRRLPPSLHATKTLKGKLSQTSRLKSRIRGSKANRVHYSIWRTRPDQTLAICLPHQAMTNLNARMGDRVWLSVHDLGVCVTKYPWGPNPGRRYSARLRICHEFLLGRLPCRFDFREKL